MPRPGTPPEGPTSEPGAGLAFLAAHYDLYHGSAEVPERLMAGFVRRRQQIGQLEILAAIVPYLSMPATLAGRDVLHWIDNTSAKAALVHGYSGAPDSSRLVHALHAYNLGLRARPWFEYVRSKANPADEPSRVDLARSRWRVLACPELVSEPVATGGQLARPGGLGEAGGGASGGGDGVVTSEACARPDRGHLCHRRPWEAVRGGGLDGGERRRGERRARRRGGSGWFVEPPYPPPCMLPLRV